MPQWLALPIKVKGLPGVFPLNNIPHCVIELNDR